MLATGAGSVEPRWTIRDGLTAAGLFLATAAVVLWQNAHIAVLWDLSYILDSASRIALGQMPYRDFPFAHAPLTFLIQAAIIRLTGHVYFHHVLYVAVVGGLGTVLTWRIVLNSLRGRISSAWTIALLLAAPLTVLGIYCVMPLPSYDCDCAFSILVAVWLLQRLAPDVETTSPPALATSTSSGKLPRAFITGAALCLPLFFKQNIGLPFLAVSLVIILLLYCLDFLSSLPRRCESSSESDNCRPTLKSSRAPSERVRRGGRVEEPASWNLGERVGYDHTQTPTLLAILAGTSTALLFAALLLHLSSGLRNYIHWTIQFAAQRRLPGLSDMLSVYRDPSLLWTLPCILAALILLRTPLAKSRWTQLAAIAFMAAPFAFTLCSLFLYDDADERGDTLLALWPLLLILAATLALFNIYKHRRHLTLRTFLPIILLVAIHGTLMSQQLWGSTYAIWPFLILLIAELLAFLASLNPQPAASTRPPKSLTPAMAAVISATLLICGAFYTVSEERLSYAQFPDGPVRHSAFPQLAGMVTPGPFLSDFDELLRYASANIPTNDGLILIPGEDPFYFVTGRTPQFPVLLFDPATDPYFPAQVVDQARRHNIRWLIVKHDLQMKEDPTPQREATLKLLFEDFTLTTRLHAYDIYHRR